MTSLSMHAAVFLEGHGVAFGQVLNPDQLKTFPYRKGTIALQSPFLPCWLLIFLYFSLEH